MSENAPQQSKASHSKNVVGGCSLACAVPFVLAGVLWPLLHALGGTLNENILMFFPLLIGLPCFIIAHILAFVAIFSKAETAKRLGKTTLLVTWGSIAISIFLLLVIPDPSGKSLIGTYTGSFRGITETIEVKSDGTFVQVLTLPSKDKLTATGNWQLKHRALMFDNYLMFIDGENGQPLTHPIRVYSMTYIYSSGTLINDWDRGYYTASRHR
jgi:hypothetical protein